MRNRRLPLRLRRHLPLLAGSVLLLSGCGVAGTQFNPGVAVQVGDVTISTRHVDQVTDDYCEALEKVTATQETTGTSRTPLRYFTHTFATELTRQAVAEQLADQYDVEPSATYKQDLAALEPQLLLLTDDQKESVREVVGARSYADDILTTIGGIELSKQGTDDANNDDKLAAGEKVFSAWVDDHDVEINPKYGVELGDEAQVDTDLSFPLSDNAEAGLAQEADPDYTAALPDHLTCLD